MIQGKINILLVEDEEIQATFVKSLLDFKKYRIRHITDGKEALDYLLTHTEPDVVLMDNHLPSMDGIEIIHRLSIQGISHPIVFVSATADINIVIEAMRTGAQDFVIKTSPNFKTEILQVIEKVFSVQIRLQQQKDLEQKIKHSEENYRNLFNEIDDYLFILNEHGNIVQANNTLLDRLGYSLEQIINKPISMLHPKVFESDFKKFIDQMFIGNLKTYYIPFESSIGEKIEVEIRVNRSVWNNQTILMGIGKDLSELKNSEDRFIKAFGTNPSAMSISNFHGKIIDINESFCKLTHYSRDEIIGRSYSDLNILTEDALQNKIHAGLIKEGQAREIELPLSSKNGDALFGIFSADLIKVDLEQCILIVITDITNRKKTEDLLRQNEERLQIALKEGKNGLWDWNYLTGEMYLTLSAFEMLDYKEYPTDFDIKALNNLIHPDDIEVSEKRLMQHIKGISDFYETEYRLKKADGAYKWVLVRGKIIERDANGSPLRITGVNIDIDKIKVLENELFAAKTLSEKANITKTRFLANMSHEIRTPMTGILGMSNLLKNTELDEKQKEFLNIIVSSAENLLVIINDILDFSKINEGKFQLSNIDFKLDTFFNNAIKSLNHLAKSKDLELRSYIDKSINNILFGDPVRLNQIVINLTGNAIKFTQSGYVEVRIELVRKEKKINIVQFSILDTGIGIDKDNIDKIFELFTQEDETISRKFGGTGLGLAISKQLVEMMGGTLSVDSTKGVGSKFFFSIELPDGNKDNVPDNKIINDKNIDLKNVRILVAEDIKINQFYIQSILNKWNINPDFADNGRIAVEMLKVKQYDLVFMDKQMPEMSGIEATRAIRYKLNLDVPIIALTAAAMKNDRQVMLKAGMNDYISKPFNPDDLLQKILTYVNIPQETSGKSETYIKSTETEVKPETIIESPVPEVKKEIPQLNIHRNTRMYSLNSLKQIFGTQVSKIREMMKLFIETSPPLLNEIEKEFNKRNYKRVKEIAHKIKPTIDMLEISNLTQIIREIEKFDKGSMEHDQLSSLVSTFIKTMNIVLKQVNDDFSV